MVAEIKGVSSVEIVGMWVLFLMRPKVHYYWDMDDEGVDVYLEDFSWWLK